MLILATLAARETPSVMGQQCVNLTLKSTNIPGQKLKAHFMLRYVLFLTEYSFLPPLESFHHRKTVT